jgi:hypothetical protein
MRGVAVLFIMIALSGVARAEAPSACAPALEGASLCFVDTESVYGDGTCASGGDSRDRQTGIVAREGSNAVFANVTNGCGSRHGSAHRQDDSYVGAELFTSDGASSTATSARWIGGHYSDASRDMEYCYLIARSDGGSRSVPFTSQSCPAVSRPPVAAMLP